MTEIERDRERGPGFFPAPRRALLLPIFLMLATLAMAQEEGAGGDGQRRMDDGNSLSDQEVTDAVEVELLVSPHVSSYLVDVETTDGIVTLSGTVDDMLAEQRALRTAETVRGVRAVIDEIDVETVDRPAEAIQQDVKQALLRDPAADSYEVDVTVTDGTVTLEGTVDSWHEHDLCTRLARGVRGVDRVDNELIVRYDGERTDGEILRDVKSALRWNRFVDSTRIDVAVQDGVVTLSGVASSAAEARMARRLVHVHGVESVRDDELNVDPSQRDDALRRQKYTNVSDDEVRAALNQALVYHPRVSGFRIDTEVDSGTVTLRGKVDSLAARHAAEQTARSTVGVWRVRNFLKVRTDEPRPDAALRQDVENAFVSHPFLSSYEIVTTANNGIVTLTGTVDSHWEKVEAEQMASRVTGVRGVRNFVGVSDARPFPTDPLVDETWLPLTTNWTDPYRHAPTMRSDWEIHEDIEDQMFWSPFVDADEVNVSVENGVATLRGTVDTYHEKSSATENAIEGGAVHVINRLNVSYRPGFEP